MGHRAKGETMNMLPYLSPSGRRRLAVEQMNKALDAVRQKRIADALRCLRLADAALSVPDPTGPTVVALAASSHVGPGA